MIYSIVISEHTEIVSPAMNQLATEPLWKLSFDGSKIHHGALSDGLSDTLATYFIVTTDNNMFTLAIPHSNNGPPRLSILTSFDEPEPLKFVPGFEKAFAQNDQGQVTRLSYSWNREAGNAHASPVTLSTCVVSRGYPCDRPQRPMLDEEVGRIIQGLDGKILIVDTALYPV